LDIRYNTAVQARDRPKPILNYSPPPPAPIRFRTVVFAVLKFAAGATMILWVLVSLFLATHVVGAKLFLACIYGPTRVWREHLTILEIPKHRPYPVSNGDFITYGHFVHFLISLVCWFAMVIGPLFLIDRIGRLFRPRRVAHS
jgi:hypothetical protein